METKGTLLSPRSILPAVTLSGSKKLLAQDRKNGGWVLESWVVTELTHCWRKNGHCQRTQGNGPRNPVPCASLCYLLSGSSKHLSTKE